MGSYVMEGGGDVGGSAIVVSLGLFSEGTFSLADGSTPTSGLKIGLGSIAVEGVYLS